MPSKRHAVTALLALAAAILGWMDVSWALRPGLFAIMDDIGTQASMIPLSYARVLNMVPQRFYADRPLGWALIKVLSDAYQFDYPKQVVWLIVVHAASCVLAFLILRRLGAGAPLAIAGVAIFAGLWTTAETVTYLGEAFDLV